MVTIKEIANRLGVSTTTVSNVIHGKTSEVSPATIELVQKMLKECGYVPNMGARNLAQNQSRIIGIVMKERKGRYTNLLSDPFYGELVGAVEKVIRSKGYYLMMNISDNMEDIIAGAASWNVDGVIMVSLDYEDVYSEVTLETFQQWLNEGKPILVAWNDWGGHWQVIIGYDTLGTETTQDDVIIVADAYDTTDHNQDGYGIYPAERFYYNFTMYNQFTEEEGGNDMLFVIAQPAE